MFFSSVFGRCAVKDPHHQDQNMMSCALAWQVQERQACCPGFAARPAMASYPQRVCTNNPSSKILLFLCLLLSKYDVLGANTFLL